MTIASLDISGLKVEQILGMTEYLVEADSFSKHELWAKYSGQGSFQFVSCSKEDTFPTVKWEQISEGRIVNLGEVSIRIGSKLAKGVSSTSEKSLSESAVRRPRRCRLFWVSGGPCLMAS